MAHHLNIAWSISPCRPHYRHVSHFYSICLRYHSLEAGFVWCQNPILMHFSHPSSTTALDKGGRSTGWDLVQTKEAVRLLSEPKTLSPHFARSHCVPLANSNVEALTLRSWMRSVCARQRKPGIVFAKSTTPLIAVRYEWNCSGQRPVGKGTMQVSTWNQQNTSLWSSEDKDTEYCENRSLSPPKRWKIRFLKELYHKFSKGPKPLNLGLKPYHNTATLLTFNAKQLCERKS